MNQSVTFKSPFEPQVLRKAGVSQEDTLWFSRQSIAQQNQAIRTPRGERILNHVRKFMSQMNQSSGMAVAA